MILILFYQIKWFIYVPYAKSISRNLIYIYTSSKPCESIYPRQLYILESGTEQIIQNDIT